MILSFSSIIEFSIMLLSFDNGFSIGPFQAFQVRKKFSTVLLNNSHFKSISFKTQVALFLKNIIAQDILYGCF